MCAFLPLCSTQADRVRLAADVLADCRRVLKYTYLFAYYMQDGADKEMFEMQQGNLDKATETLSHQLERPPDRLVYDSVRS